MVHHPRRSPPLRRRPIRHAIPKAPPACGVFWQQHTSNQNMSAQKTQPHHLSYDNAAYAGSDISARCPSSLYEGFFYFNPNVHDWKTPRGRPETTRVDSIKHDLHSAGLKTAIADQMVFDRPLLWKDFVNGLPTSNPSRAQVKSIHP